MTANANEWYSDGLHFECTCCGECCTGSTGYVAVTSDECDTIARKLGISSDEFLATYTHTMKHGREGISLNEHKTEHGYDCVFLDRDTEPGKALCAIHDARPQQCRTWPFWPENIASPRAWQRTSRACEGINQGRLYTIDEIRIQRDQTPP
ncbi:MAG: YkgJ family cysteine cluster protein [Phycisphaerales bacterium JB043]